MNEKTGVDIFLDHMPIFSNKIWHKIIPTYLYQILIFVSVMFFFWWISSTFWICALLFQFMIAFVSIYPYEHLAINSNKIRKKYREKYGKFAYQKFWYRYMSWTIPLITASLYLPLLLKTDYFLPTIVSLPSNFFTITIFPIYIALPLGVIFIYLGLKIRRMTGNFDMDVNAHIYLIYPEKSRIVKGGTYDYIRHPLYLGRGFIAIGLGIIANNFLAICVALIHFLAWCLLIPSEEKDIAKRLGADFENYRRSVPALLPRYGHWRKFVKFIFVGENK